MQWRWDALIGTVTLCALVGHLGCAGDVKPIITDAHAAIKVALLENAADCAIARYQDAEQAVITLQSATQAYASDPANAVALAQAQQAWRDAMGAWQVAELYRFGPAASSMDPGGQDIRDQIYAWPLFSRCKVDEQIVSQTYAGINFSQSLINGRGLGAIEYLLFYNGAENGCSSFSTINVTASWAALTAEELQLRRAAYAYASTTLVLGHLQDLIQRWQASGGNFRATFIPSSSGNGTFASTHEAANVVSHGLLYIEGEVKDLKLAKPLGLSTDCAAALCPEAVESPYAQVSADHLLANIRAGRQVFQGCSANANGIGFDDWLVAVGASDLGIRILAAFDHAEAAILALGEPLETALTTDTDKVRAVHAGVRQITDLLKTEFVSNLNLELPRMTEGDND